MRLLILMLIAIFLTCKGFSQQPEKFMTTFIYGKLVKEKDTLTGYFRFSPDISRSGQIVDYRDSFRSYTIEKLKASKYDYFVSDSFYLETFRIQMSLTKWAKAMIPRIVNGKIQLFEITMDGLGLFNMGSSVFFFIKTEYDKFQVTKSNFKQQMHSFINDEELLHKIDNEELQYADLPQIITTFNNLNKN